MGAGGIQRLFYLRSLDPLISFTLHPHSQAGAWGAREPQVF